MSLWKMALAIFGLSGLAGLSTNLFLAKKLSASQWAGLTVMSGLLGVTWFLWGYEAATATPNTFWRHFANSIVAGFGSSVIVSYGIRIFVKQKMAKLVSLLGDSEDT